MCVCERQRQRERERERERERDSGFVLSVCVCVCLCVRDTFCITTFLAHACAFVDFAQHTHTHTQCVVSAAEVGNVACGVSNYYC